MGKIIIENYEIFAHHGLFENEQKIGRQFVVNMLVTTNFDVAAKNDEIEGTVNYARLCDIITEQMKTPSKLLENVGYRITIAIKKEFSTIEKVELKIQKLNPPINGKIGSVGIILEEIF